MADDPTAEMISMTTGVVTALRAAGMPRGRTKSHLEGMRRRLRLHGRTATVKGDQVSIFPLVAVAKTFETQPKDLMRFTLTEARRSVRGDEARW